MSELVSIPDLVKLGVSEATIYRKTKPDGEWKWTLGPAPGGKGLRRPKLIVVSSLPVELQLAWAKLDSERRTGTTPAEDDQSHQMIPSPDDRLDALQSALARYSPPAYTLEQRQSVEQRCIELGHLCDEAIKLIASLKRSTGISVSSPGASEAGPGRKYHPDLAKLAARTVSTDPVYLAMYPSASKSISVPTFLRLIKQYRQRGLVVFIRQRQTLSPEKDDRFIDVPQEAIDWLRANLKNYVKASVTLYGEKWLEWAKRNNVKLPFTDYRPGNPGTGYKWLYRWVKNIPNASLVLAREGKRGFDAKYAVITRRYDDLRPRVGYTMDWRTSDIPCWLPFKKDKSKKPVLVRLVVCTVFDLKSRAVFGYRIDDRPSARGVTLAYLDAITHSDWKQEAGFETLCGIQRGANGIEPFVLWDNGKDFRAYSVEGKEIKVGKIELENGLIGVLDSYKVGLAVDAKFEVRHSKYFNAKSKIVEPFHRYGIGLAEEGMPGYCGKRPEDKPHYYAAALKIHKSFMNGDTPKLEDLRQLPSNWRDTYERYKETYGFGTPFPSEADYRDWHRQLMIGYNQKPHGSLANERGEMSPIEYVNFHAEAPHKVSEKTVAALMMEARVMTVVADRVPLNWYGQRFWYNEVSSDLSDGTYLLRIPEKTKVEVRFNPDDIGRALVLTQGAAVCWVECKNLMGWNATREDFQRAYSEKKKAEKVANEFFDLQGQAKDWRDFAEERMPKALPVAVNAGEVFEEEQQEGGPASVTMMTRFDRKSPDAPPLAARESSHLQVVNPQPDEDEFDSLKSFETSDSADEIKAGWED
jgi:hypothetical protein